MRCLIFLCLALAGATTAFGQNYPQEVRVPGGRLVQTFVPDGTPIAPQQPVYQQPQTVIPHGHQHAGNCGCPVCKRTLVGRTKEIYSETHTTIVTKENYIDKHPVQFFNEFPSPAAVPRNPCPPQDPCLRQGGGGRPSVGLAQWDTGFRGYRPQQSYGYAQNRQLIGFNFLGLTVGFNGNAGVGAGYGNAPYQSSGYGYSGNQPWYGR